MKTNLLKSVYAIFFMAAIFLVSCDNDDQQGSETEEERTLESASVGEDASDDALEIAYQSETQLVSSEFSSTHSEYPQFLQ